MSSKPVLDLIASFSADPTQLGGPMSMSISDVTQAFSRPEIANCSDPYIAVASIEYKPGKRAEALEAWKHVASETQNNEADTLSYGVYRNREHAETVKTVEAYRSEKYFREVHVPSQAVQGNLAKFGGEIRVRVEHVMLRLVGGFLDKGVGGSNL